MTPEEYRSSMAAAMLEAQLQAAILGTPRAPGLADSLGWRGYHTHRSDRSPAGFPDLVLVKASAGRLIFAELKRERRGKRDDPTPDQRAWLDDLGIVAELVACHASNDALAPPPLEVHVWRPMDLLDGTIERILRRVE